MDVENAKLLSVGEIKETNSGHKLVNIKVRMPLGEPKTFVIFENREASFDIVRKIERGLYQPGQEVSFNFNKAKQSWQFDNIWKLRIRKDVDERGKETDSGSTGSGG